MNLYTIKKYNGDDAFSWAVFKKKDLKHLPKTTIIMCKQARPIVSGLNRRMAIYYKKKLEERNDNKE